VTSRSSYDFDPIAVLVKAQGNRCHCASRWRILGFATNNAHMLTATILRGDVDGNENFDCDDGPQQKSSTLIHRAARQKIEFVVVDRSASSSSKWIVTWTNGNASTCFQNSGEMNHAVSEATVGSATVDPL
jgi:hypothetical protein